MENLTNEEIGQKLVDLVGTAAYLSVDNAMHYAYHDTLQYGKEAAISKFKSSFLVRKLLPYVSEVFIKSGAGSYRQIPAEAKSYFYDKMVEKFGEYYDAQHKKYDLPDNVDTAIAIGYYSKEMFELLKQYARNEPDVIAILDAIVASTKTGQFVEPEVY